MIRVLSFVMFFFFNSQVSLADVGALFTPVKAILVIQGDSDAVRLFDAMNAAETDAGPAFVKFHSFNESTGLPYFDLACRKGKAGGVPSSCTMNIYKSSFAQIDGRNKTIQFRVNDVLAPEIGIGFNLLDQSGNFFESIGKKIKIQFLNFNQEDQVFSISYQ